MSRRIYRQEVPVEFNGKQLFVKNVTKYTTCSDVVHMLLLKAGIPIEQLSSYALFEATGDLDRMMQGRSRILKTLRSWGCEKDNFKFVLRNTDADSERMLGENCRDLPNGKGEVYVDRSNFHCNNESIDDLCKYSVKVSLQQKQLMTRNNVAAKEPLEKLVNKDCNIPDKHRKIHKINKQSKNFSKQVLLKKYLSSLLPFKKVKRFTRKTQEVAPDNRKHGFENLVNDDAQLQFNTLEERCRYFWNSNSESDDESDFEDGFTSFKESDLNNAFLKGLTVVNHEDSTFFNDSDMHCGDLNDAFVNEHNEMADDSLLSDILEDQSNIMQESKCYGSIFSDISDCELDKNITSCDVVRNIFCGQPLGGAVSEDEEMDSFMRTHLYESDSDESLF